MAYQIRQLGSISFTVSERWREATGCRVSSYWWVCRSVRVSMWEQVVWHSHVKAWSISFLCCATRAASLLWAMEPLDTSCSRSVPEKTEDTHFKRAQSPSCLWGCCVYTWLYTSNNIMGGICSTWEDCGWVINGHLYQTAIKCRKWKWLFTLMLSVFCSNKEKEIIKKWGPLWLAVKFMGRVLMNPAASNLETIQLQPHFKASTGCHEAQTIILDCNVPLFSCSMNSTGLLTADAEHLGVNRMTRNLWNRLSPPYKDRKSSRISFTSKI